MKDVSNTHLYKVGRESIELRTELPLAGTKIAQPEPKLNAYDSQCESSFFI